MRVRACVCLCVRVCARARAFVCVRVCVCSGCGFGGGSDGERVPVRGTWLARRAARGGAWHAVADAVDLAREHEHDGLVLCVPINDHLAGRESAGLHRGGELGGLLLREVVERVILLDREVVGLPRLQLDIGAVLFDGSRRPVERLVRLLVMRELKDGGGTECGDQLHARFDIILQQLLHVVDHHEGDEARRLAPHVGHPVAGREEGNLADNLAGIDPADHLAVDFRDERAGEHDADPCRRLALHHDRLTLVE
eukprot:1526937-Prymnesium_polylepis.2